MDQEKFDQHLMDYLFDELDEVTRAAMKRKLESDAECREIEAGLRATLEVGELPLEEPSEDLEERILSAASLAQDHEPWHRKLVRSLSWAGSHAMRPQFAMAALLMLVLGSSILLLRARPGSVAVTPGKDQAGVPVAADEAAPTEPEAAATAIAQQTPADSPAEAAPKAVAQTDEQGNDEDPEDPAAVALADGEVDATYGRALDNFKAGNFGEAQKDFAAVNRAGGKQAAMAGLYEARAARAQASCEQAIPIYARVRQNHGGSGAASHATWEQADCYRLLGQNRKATKLLLALKDDKTYGSRAAHELANQGEAGTSGKGALANKRKAAAPPPAKAPAGGSTGKAPAAPRPDAYDSAAF